MWQVALALGGSVMRTRLVLALLVSAQLVVLLDASIVNVALPSIQADLRTGAVGLTWVVNTYVLVFGGLLLLSGRAADIFGRRRMFVAGSAVFTAGTLMAAASSDAWQLIVGRGVQGVGAAALSPAAMSLLVLTFTGRARAKAMSAWGAASTVGGAVGIVVGGLLAGSLGWRANFLVTVPVIVVTMVLASRVLPADSGRARTNARGLGLVLVPLHLFRSRVLSIGVAAAVFGGAARASTFVLAALYLQQALELAPARAGLAMVPTSVIGFVVSIVALPRLLHAFGPQRTMVAGLVVLAGGHLWLAHAPLGTSYVVAVLPGLALVAVGVALSFMPTTMVITSAVPEQHSGLASGLAGSASQAGAALGTAAFVSLGLAAGGGAGDILTREGFTVAFTAAAVVALATALLGTRLLKSTRSATRSGAWRRAGAVLPALIVFALAPAALRMSPAHADPGEGLPAADAGSPLDVDWFVADRMEAASTHGEAVPRA